MIAVYSDNEKKSAEKKRVTMLVAWWILFAVVAATEIILFVTYFVRVETTLDRSLQTPLMLTAIILSVIFCFFSLFFFGIKYRYTKAYCKLYRDMLNGPKTSGKGKVLESSDSLTEKYAVKFKSVTVECPPVRRSERNVCVLLIEKDHSAPELEPGTEINFVSQSNILLGYEITKKAANAPLCAEESAAPVGNDGADNQ